MRVHRASGNDIPLAVLNNQSLNQVFVGGQLVTNGDFDNGTTGWASLSSTSTVSNGIISNVGNGTSVSPFLRHTFTPYVTDTFYSVFRVRVTNPNATSIIFSLRGSSTAGTTINIQQNTPIQNAFYVLSGKETLSGGSGDLQIRIIHNYVDTATANGSQMDVDYAYAYNLTSLGIDTLTQSQLDYLFTVWQFNQVNALVARQFIQEA
jgi:hypothetical protein